MSPCGKRVASVLLWLALVPASVFAQASITGVVKDSSGAVLPGVTVEASSPSLIEKARTAVSDGSGQYRIIDLRDFTHDRHRTVDDYPYGGGPGMVMKPGPFFEAVEALDAKAPIVLLSARGRRFAQADAIRFAQGTELTLLCGHYKDVDQRVADHLATEELSLGDFVLTGGEPAALAVIDATVRLLPGAMSDPESARGDSFYERGLSAPSYTRPPDYRGLVVPVVEVVAGRRLGTGRGGEEPLRRPGDPAFPIWERQ